MVLLFCRCPATIFTFNGARLFFAAHGDRWQAAVTPTILMLRKPLEITRLWRNNTAGVWHKRQFESFLRGLHRRSLIFHWLSHNGWSLYWDICPRRAERCMSGLIMALQPPQALKQLAIGLAVLNHYL